MTHVAPVSASVFSLVVTIIETSDMSWLATLKTGDMPLRFLLVFSLHD